MEFNDRVLSIADYPTAELASRKKKLSEAGKKLFDFGTGDPIEPTPSFIREAVGAGTPEISQYPSVAGLALLRQTIQAYMQRRFNVELHVDKEILPCTGSKEAIYNITFLLIGPNNPKDILVAGTPGYSVMERSAIVSGAHYYPYYLNKENNFLLDLAVLPEDVLKRTALAWINYPHNPTGTECTLEYLKAQVEIAKKYDILLCSDECYCDIYFSNTLPPSILQVTKEGVLAFHSCSKRSGMTAYRTGFIAGDQTVLKHFSSFRNTIGVATPIYTQHAAIKAWQEDTHAEGRRKIFKAKKEELARFFESRGLEVTKTNAGLYLWIKAPRGLSGKEYAAKLLDHGIIVSPGEFFGRNSTEYFRVALVPSLEDCKEAISVWGSISNL